MLLVGVVLRCRTTEKGFAKAGILQPESPIKNRTEQKPFSFFQTYKKKEKRNGFLRLKEKKSSTQGTFNPAFAKPMLCDVFF